MTYDPNIHHRRSIRLKGYDYSQAMAYFITICVQDRVCLFGKIINVEMILNDSGKMVDIEWLALKERFPKIELHEYVIMPNHFHAILEIVDVVGAPLVGAQNMIALNKTVSTMDTVFPNDMDDGRPQGHAPTVTQNISPTGKTVGDMLDAFKSITTVKYIHGVKTLSWEQFNRKLWQRNYHEHIIHDKQSYHRISDYIIANPAKWNDDKFYKQ